MAGAAVDAKEASKVEASVVFLWNLFLALGEAGAMHKDFVALSPASKVGFKDMVSAGFRECPLSMLRAACGVLRRWRAWATLAEDACASPSAILVALWLRSLRSRGPTAAHGTLATLVWLEDHIGLRAHSRAPLVRQQAAVGGGHVPDQAIHLRVRVWAFLEELASTPNPFVRAVALAWLLCTAGALRFAHLQRSTLLRMTDCGMFFRASRGKTRTQGVRKPFEWTVPRLGLTGLDLGAQLEKHLAYAGSMGYMIPDFGPKMGGSGGRCVLPAVRYDLA